MTLNQSMHKPKGKGVEPKTWPNKDEQVRVTKYGKGKRLKSKVQCSMTEMVLPKMRAESSREILLWERFHCRISNDRAETFYRYCREKKEERRGQGSRPEGCPQHLYEHGIHVGKSCSPGEME